MEKFIAVLVAMEVSVYIGAGYVSVSGRDEQGVDDDLIGDADARDKPFKPHVKHGLLRIPIIIVQLNQEDCMPIGLSLINVIL